MTPHARQWYRFANTAADPTVAELIIFSDIGVSYWGDDSVSSKSFMNDLKALPDTVSKIVVRVNSLGGDVFEAVAIANALRDQVRKGRTVQTIVDGIAASAASIVIMAGETIQIADNGLVMVHNPWTFAIGNAAELRKTADALDAIRNTITATYKWHSTLSDEELVALMDAETWMSADEAIANGFATEKVEGLKAAASLDAGAYFKTGTLTIPEKYRARVQALLTPEPVAASADEVLSVCRDAECLDLAQALIAAHATIDVVRARVASETETRTQAATRAKEIRALCATAKLPEFTDDYITGGLSLVAIRASLTTLTAKRDRIEIDGGLLPDQASRQQPVLSTTAIYAERNKRRLTQ